MKTLRESPRIIAWGLLCLGMVTLPCILTGAPDPAGAVLVQATLEKLVDVRTLTSSEKQKAREQEQLLKARVELLQLRINEVKERIAKDEGEAAEAAKTSTELEQESKALDDALSVLEKRVADLERRTLFLLKYAPDPLLKKVEPLSQQIPKEGDDKDRSLSIRYQNVIGVLDAMNTFNNQVAVTTEVRDLGGQSLEVRVLYLGLAQAYFTNQDASRGGVGLPATNGWKWTGHDEIAPAVDALIAQHLNEKPAAYGLLPVQVMKIEEPRP